MSEEKRATVSDPLAHLTHMKALIDKLQAANKAYEQENRELLTDFEYDQRYDQLLALEKESGITLSNSPTQRVGYAIVSELPKERHASKMLSLDKTKDRQALVDWIGAQEGLLSWKLDGLTIVLTYENGILIKGVTRGNGEIGEVITSNVRVFDNVPLTIQAMGTVTVRGEAVIRYEDFLRINEALPPEEHYKNPRNLCSGTVRQLNNEVTAKRRVHFYAFQLVESSREHVDTDSKWVQLKWLSDLGFDVVEHEKVNRENILDIIDTFEDKIPNNPVATDGLVLTFDGINYSESLGVTSKFPRHSIAFKWRDELKETHLTEVEWRASRTGLINPIAIFEAVELEGTTVSRASLHNVSIVKELALGIGDTIEVYKANMIIPQVARNLTRSGHLEIPSDCPVCHEATRISSLNEVEVLVCDNAMCPAKKIKAFSHFVSRDAMNIEGFSEATIEKFIQAGLLHDLSDLYHLDEHQATIETMEGMGPKSYQNLIEAIEKKRACPLPNFIYALGISNVGLNNAKLLCNYYDDDLDKIMAATPQELIEIEGYGEVIAQAIHQYFEKAENAHQMQLLRQELNFEKRVTVPKGDLVGKVFVITGTVTHYLNRNALKDHIERLGGKVSGSVSVKTDYLINNDVASSSGKNKKAKELGVPIINEEQFLALLS